jgi:2-amino-4-hydroxy-6-hydroxymethyldihydropteridine diphosphokinase
MCDLVRSVQAYIGIGSNLANPIVQVRQAFQALASLPLTCCVARSPLYRSAPLGPPGQPDYINAVAALVTRLAPEALLQALQNIEQVHGRVRTLRWGPRTLDLDILLYGNLVQNMPYLVIPHPHLQERAFVLYPLQDIAPALVIRGLGDLATLVQRCPSSQLERLEI